MHTEISTVETCLSAMNAGFSSGLVVGLFVGAVLVWAYDRWANR